jgi:cytochrome c oxidase cbb3-type subunit I/II
LGAPYSEEQIANCEADARHQAEVIAAEIVAQGGPAAMQEKQAMAVIAYLQRMGTDIFKTPTPAGGEKPAEAAEPQPAESSQPPTESSQAGSLPNAIGEKS